MADTNPQIQPVRGGGAASASAAASEIDESDPVELVLFHVNDCYVYLIPPRMSAASYRADEWDVNKWAWEGALKVASKGEECIIKLEDRTTGELYARAFLRNGEPHPVETVIDSSRYFVLRVEENIGGRLRHAFIGIGFRERPQAYDFQAALHDHMKYLDKKRTAEEMEQHYQTSTVDYSLKEGETFVLQLKNNKEDRPVKSAFFEQGLNNLSPDGKGSRKEGMLCLKPPPPPPAPFSASNPVQQAPASDSDLQSSATDAIPLPTAVSSPVRNDAAALEDAVSSKETSPVRNDAAAAALEDAVSSKETSPVRNDAAALEDEFGDFQVAG